jgi:chlorobactene glucosyltransferase
MTAHLVPAVAAYVLVPLLLLCGIHSVVGMIGLPRLRPLPPDPAEGPQDVSVLVPVRNEEKRIESCLRSLMAQEPPVREILLLDDRSVDATAEIARRLGFSEEPGARLRLLPGAELPAGWVGKNWACHQLSCAANPTSGHLLFTDADTVHGPASVRTALGHAARSRADLLSVWPDQITGTWAEKLIIPLGYLLFTAFQPLPLLRWLQADPGRVARWGFTREKLASLGAANGQFLLFRRESYFRIGGHEALRDHLVEDIAFGRRVAAATGEGMRLVNADGIDLVQCRMYSDFREVWEGFSKNLRPVFEQSRMGFVVFGVAVSFLFLLPFLLPALPGGLTPAPVASLLIVVVLRLLLTLRFRTSWFGFVAHPGGVVLALLIALNSWRLCAQGGVFWKGRRYPGTTGRALG